MESDTPKGRTTSLPNHIPPYAHPVEGGFGTATQGPTPATSPGPATPDERAPFNTAWSLPPLHFEASPTTLCMEQELEEEKDEEKEIAPPGASGPNHEETHPARALWWYLSLANLAWHTLALSSGIYLYQHPHEYPLSTRYFVNHGVFRLTGGAYNALITFVSQVASAAALGIFGRIVYAYVVNRLDHDGMSVKTFEKWLSVGGGRIKWKSLSALFYTLPGFILFTAYATSLSVSYTLTPVTITNTFPMVAINLTANDMNLGIAFQTGNLTGNAAQRYSPDYETTLGSVADMYDVLGDNATDYGRASISGAYMISTGPGMVLGAWLPTTISTRVMNGMTNATTRVVALIEDQYGLNKVGFNATGVQGNTTCGLSSPRFATLSTNIGGGFLMTNFTGTRCGNTSLVHAIPRDRRLVYDVFTCPQDGNITTIVFSVDGMEGVQEHTVCTTKLFDTFAVGGYLESLNSYAVDDEYPQTVTPMSDLGSRIVQNFTERGWVANLGGVGSHALFQLLNGTLMDSDTAKSRLEYSLSLMYSLAGAKIINLASSSAQEILDERRPPLPYINWIHENITVEVETDARQIGMERDTLPWITVTILHVILGIVILMLAWRHQSTAGVDPSLPTTLHLVRDDTAGRIHAVPAKPTQDSMRIVLRHD